MTRKYEREKEKKSKYEQMFQTLVKQNQHYQQANNNLIDKTADLIIDNEDLASKMKKLKW